MFGENLNLESAAPAPAPLSIPSARNFLRDFYGDDEPKKGGKGKGKGKGSGKKRSDKGGRRKREEDRVIWELMYDLGWSRAENRLLKNMMELALASSKRTLHEDVLEVGVLALGDGKQ